MISKFLREESGATAIEYALIAGLVALAIITALTAMGTSLSNFFDTAATKVNAANP